MHGSERVLEYLGRYVHRTALSGKALLGADEQTVTFRYRNSGDHRRKTMTLPAHEFLRRFLQHVPPKGFHRVRAFGLLYPEHRATLRRLQLLLAPSSAPLKPGPASAANSKTSLKCPHCRQLALRLMRRLSPLECLERANAARAVVHTARAPPDEAGYPTTRTAHP
jgi:hypothetical protein